MTTHMPNCAPEPARVVSTISLWSGLAAATVLVTYIAVLYVMPKHVFWAPDEGGRYIELRTLAWNNGINYVLQYPARHLDPELRFFPVQRCYPKVDAEGNLRLSWPIWFPLLNLPFFNLFGTPGIYVIPLLCGWLIALVSGFVAQKLGSPHGPLVILIVGLASPVFFYSLAFWEHTAATALAMLAVAVVIAADGRGTALLGALALAMVACLMRLEMLAFVPALLVAVLVANARAPVGGHIGFTGAPRWRWPLVVTGIALIAALLLTFGLTLPASRWNFILGPRVTREGLLFLPRIPGGLVEAVINSQRAEGPELHPGWSYAAAVAVIVAVAGSFVRRSRVEAALFFPAFAFVLALSTWIVLSEQRYRAVHGIVPIAPYILAGWYVLSPAWRQRRRTQLLLATLGAAYAVFGLAAIVTFYVGSRGLESTLEWGQRYMLTIYPLFGILAVLAVGEYWRSARGRPQRFGFTVLVAAAVLIAVQFQYRGLSMAYANRELLMAWEAELRGHTPLVTEAWWLPTAVPELAMSSDVLVAREPKLLLAWIESARRQGLPSFIHAGVDSRVTEGPWAPGVSVRRRWTYRNLQFAEFELLPP